MKNNIVQIITAYLYHTICIIICFMLMQNYIDALIITTIILYILYLIYWIAINRKKYMPWIVYFNFVTGTVIEAVLNLTGVIHEDGGWFSGLGQAMYLILIGFFTVLIGISNMVMYIMHNMRKQ